MLPQNGRRPPPRDAGDDLPNEQPTKALDHGCNDNTAPSQDAPPSVVDAVDLARFDYLAEVLDYAASYAVSAREAARRGNHELLRLHVNQAKMAVDAAAEVEAELGSLDTAA